MLQDRFPHVIGEEREDDTARGADVQRERPPQLHRQLDLLGTDHLVDGDTLLANQGAQHHRLPRVVVERAHVGGRSGPQLQVRMVASTEPESGVTEPVAMVRSRLYIAVPYQGADMVVDDAFRQPDASGDLGHTHGLARLCKHAEDGQGPIDRSGGGVGLLSHLEEQALRLRERAQLRTMENAARDGGSVLQCLPYPLFGLTELPAANFDTCRRALSRKLIAWPPIRSAGLSSAWPL